MEDKKEVKQASPVEKAQFTIATLGADYQKAVDRVTQLQNALEQAKGELKYIVRLRNAYSLPAPVGAESEPSK